MDVWREKLTVRIGCVDSSDRLNLWSIFDFFQEAATSHAAVLGVGREEMTNAGQAWVLSRFSLFVKRRPFYGETIEVSTWPRRCEKLFAYRDYEIKDAEGAVLVSGRGAWLLLDKEKRRPLRPQTLVETLPANEGLDAFPAAPSGLEVRENLTKIMQRNALYSDLDYYGHANNARYIQWIQDAADIDILTNADQFRLDINYLNEVLPGDLIEIWAAPLDGGADNDYYPSPPGPAFFYEGKKAGSDKVMFRAELHTGLYGA